MRHTAAVSAGAALLTTALVALLVTSAAAHDAGSTVRTEEWALGALEVPQAWEETRGRGVTVAVLDTGVDGRHPDLAGQVVQGPDLTGVRGGGGRHGTAMAGLIAGHGHGPGRDNGIVGIAPEARILSVRVTLENDDPRRADPAVISRLRGAVAGGIRYAVDHGAQVISMSLGAGSGSYQGSPAEVDAIQYALDRGVVLVASSGNDGAGANRRNFPAAYPGVIAVGAVDRLLRPAAFSNRHDYLSVVAPGMAIVSADGHDAYVQGDGTSSAAALVAGVAALVRARHPELSGAEVRRAIQAGTLRRPQSGRDDAYGHGVVNARLALRAAATLRPRPATHGEGPDKAITAALVGLAVAMATRVRRRPGRHLAARR
ncbi:S8 family serine peptidase [Streptosporangiaceae bacterium NEAU-GS5]|nr:S8 family serine peptidase [Streptosporangiaceae bacterium NEAU-GS5]